MEARLRRHGDVTVIAISGALTIEETQPFHEACLKQFQGQKIVFNMQNASFVGSTGICSFLETLKSMSHKTPHGVRLSNVQSEFRRMVGSLESNQIQIFEEESGAVKDWLHPFVLGSTDGSTLG